MDDGSVVVADTRLTETNGLAFIATMQAYRIAYELGKAA
jgi:hypothetical protein